jgi:hypothetical protein
MSNYTIYWLQKEIVEQLVSTFQSKIQKEFVNPLINKFVKEIIMTAKNDYREFNLEHAKKGAPLKLRSGMPARILATDIKKDMGYEIAVVVQDTPRGREYVVTRTIDGSFSSAGISSNDLVMAPVFYIGETPIYFGDKVEYSSCIERIWSRF